jgi:hypothetical protein
VDFSPNLRHYVKNDGAIDRLDGVSLKAAGRIKIEDASQGTVTAVVSVMNVVDRDGDVVLPGAIPDGTRIKLSAYDHDVITEGLIPAGVGTVSTKGDNIVMVGQYFMHTTRGRDAFEAIKGMGPDCEWSIGFSKQVRETPMTPEWRSKGAKRLIAGMNLMEASPVFLGANQFTRTLATKQADRDLGYDATIEKLWFAAASTEELIERGEMAAMIYKASQRGVQLSTKDIEDARNTMRRVSAQLELRLLVDRPDEYRAMMEERALERKQQEILLDMDARVRDGLALELKREHDRRMQWALLDTFTRGERLASAMQPAADLPLPETYWPIVRFGMRQLGLKSSQAPRIFLAAQRPTSVNGGVQVGSKGHYDKATKEIRVRYDLPDDEIETTLLHELGHHYLELTGRPQNERFPEETARNLMRQWRQADRSEWE